MRLLKVACIGSIVTATLVPTYALAIDGVFLINQSKALAGDITPGDTAGFPVTISRRGSYRLSSNLTVPDANTHAIDIRVNEVTLDLNGFAIAGPTLCSGSPLSCAPLGTGQGVRSTGTGLRLRNITVMNGTIRGMGDRGINLLDSGRVEKIHATHNGDMAIFCGRGCLVSGNTAAFNNGGGGLTGPAILATGVVQGNSAWDNRMTGIEASGVVHGNSAQNNGNYGIVVFCPSSALGNAATSNAVGNLRFEGAGCSSAVNSAP